MHQNVWWSGFLQYRLGERTEKVFDALTPLIRMLNVECFRTLNSECLERCVPHSYARFHVNSVERCVPVYKAPTFLQTTLCYC